MNEAKISILGGLTFNQILSKIQEIVVLTRMPLHTTLYFFNHFSLSIQKEIVVRELLCILDIDFQGNKAKYIAVASQYFADCWIRN